MFENVFNSLFGSDDDSNKNAGQTNPDDGGDTDDPQNGGEAGDALPGGVDPSAPYEPRVADDFDPDDEPTSDPADGAAAVARNASDTNTVVPQSDGPIITPPVRVLFQYDGRWAYNNLRPPNTQNGCYSPSEKSQRGEGDPNSWKDNGCYPTCFTMVMRWWCEDYPPTKGAVDVPNKYATYPATLDPVAMCQIFSGTPYFHCALNAKNPLALRCQTAMASNTQPDNGKAGPTTGSPPKCNTLFSLSPPSPDGSQPCTGGCGADFTKSSSSASVAAGHNTYSVGEISPYAKQLGFQGNKMSFERWPCLKTSGDDKAAKLKAWLLCGPVLANMTNPGHWVVVTGYRDNIIHLSDPGWIIAKKKKYFKGGTTGDGDTTGVGYVTVDEAWLAFVINLDLITFHSIVDANQNAAWLN